MIIEEKDFRLTPSNNTASDYWDLELLVSIKPKGTATVARTDFKNVGYGLSMYSAIKRICNYRIQHKHKEESISLTKYLKEYIALLTELRKTLMDNSNPTQLLD